MLQEARGQTDPLTFLTVIERELCHCSRLWIAAVSTHFLVLIELIYQIVIQCPLSLGSVKHYAEFLTHSPDLFSSYLYNWLRTHM